MLATDVLGRTRETSGDELPESYLKAFDQIDNDPNNELIVMTDEKDEVCGTLQLTFIPGLTYQGAIRAQIEAVRIHDDWRGQGLGKILMKWAIERSQKRGARIIQLTSNKHRTDAIAFYKKLGFNDSHEGMKIVL